MLKSSINVSDIQITDLIIPEDLRNGGYNLGDLLNIPNLNNDWNSIPHADIHQLNRMKLLGSIYKDSILQFYCNGRSNDEESIPNINLIKQSVNKFISINYENLYEIINIIKDTNTCCVHLRNGDLESENDYINIIINLSKKFNKIIILSGIHLDNMYKSEIDKKINFVTTINNILQKNNNIFIYLNTADIHLSIMSLASNLLIHKGGFSCLGSIVCNGNLYVTKYFTHKNKENWINKVNNKYIIL